MYNILYASIARKPIDQNKTFKEVGEKAQRENYGSCQQIKISLQDVFRLWYQTGG